ncbi:hypothetical protein ABFS83_01G074400 [Erythranthe nasuta]
MANLSSSALCLLIILLFSSVTSNMKAADLAAASPPEPEPCYVEVGTCNVPGSNKEKDEICKKKCSAYFHKDHDGFCQRSPNPNEQDGTCFCPVDCKPPRSTTVKS